MDWAATDVLCGYGAAFFGTRTIIRVNVSRISDSCGYAVPFYEYTGPRDILLKSANAKGAERLAEYRRENNAKSIDGLPGLVSEDL